MPLCEFFLRGERKTILQVPPQKKKESQLPLRNMGLTRPTCLVKVQFSYCMGSELVIQDVLSTLCIECVTHVARNYLVVLLCGWRVLIVNYSLTVWHRGIYSTANDKRKAPERAGRDEEFILKEQITWVMHSCRGKFTFQIIPSTRNWSGRRRHI